MFGYFVRPSIRICHHYENPILNGFIHPEFAPNRSYTGKASGTQRGSAAQPMNCGLRKLHGAQKVCDGPSIRFLFVASPWIQFASILHQCQCPDKTKASLAKSAFPQACSQKISDRNGDKDIEHFPTLDEWVPSR